MEPLHCRKADCIDQRKLLIRVCSDNLQRFSLFSLPDTVDPSLAFVEFIKNPERRCVSDAVEKQRMRFRNNVVGGE